MASGKQIYGGRLFGGSYKPLILMSLKPQYWQLVLDGEKKYEYRRSFRKDAVGAYIYLSSPRQCIAGFIDFGEPIIDTPQRIVELAESQSPGSRDGMADYLAGSKQGFAVPILSHQQFQPIGLQELREKFGFTPPQGYLVLDNHRELRKFIEARHSR